MTPLVSVLMPVYNAERYVAEAVESILAQTFADFEFIIVDDGSTDGSLAILQNYQARDSRIRLISRPNTGLVVALNEMLDLSTGEYLARMDADDVALPERFALQIAYLKANPDVFVVGGRTILIDERNRTLAELPTAETDADILAVMLTGHPAITHPSVMMRLEAVRSVGGYHVDKCPAEDIDLFLRLGERGKLANLPVPVLKYRIHSQSTSHKQRKLVSDRLKAAVSESCQRRGIPCPDFAPAELRPEDDRSSRHKFMLRYGWWAFGSGERATAVHYALKSIFLMPWRLDGWRLLFCIAIKSPAKKAS